MFEIELLPDHGCSFFRGCWGGFGRVDDGGKVKDLLAGGGGTRAAGCTEGFLGGGGLVPP